MTRMLGGPIPRRQSFLNALLGERIVCFVPRKEDRRKWDSRECAEPLPPAARAAYDAIFGRRAHLGGKDLYGRLRAAVEQGFNAPAALRHHAEVLAADGWRPLVFARSDREKAAVLDGWGGKAPRGARVVTVARAAFGLNLQADHDAIVCRPVGGDILAQMKGRVDRPGQAKDTLALRIVFAAGTVEEAEAANIRICNGFVRQYLAPHSVEFRNVVLGATGGASGAAATIRRGLVAAVADGGSGTGASGGGDSSTS